MPRINDIDQELIGLRRNAPTGTQGVNEYYTRLNDLQTQKDIYEYASGQGYKGDANDDLGYDKAVSYLQGKGLYDTALGQAGFSNKAKAAGFTYDPAVSDNEIYAAQQYLDSHNAVLDQARRAGLNVGPGTQYTTTQQISDYISNNQDASQKFNQEAFDTERTAESVKEAEDAELAAIDTNNEDTGGITREPRDNSVQIQTPDGRVHNVIKGSKAHENYLAAGGKVTNKQKTEGTGMEMAQQQAQSSIDVITDPVTGNSYYRDLSIPGSTYQPYNGQIPTAPVTDISTPGTYTSSTPDSSDTTTLDDILGSFGYQFSSGAGDLFKISPAKSFKEVYNGILDQTEFDDWNKEAKKLTKKIDDLDQELADKIADINEDPWLTEGVRAREVQKLQDRYELKRAPFASNLNLYKDFIDDAKEEARYISTQALQQYNTERQFQLEQIQMMMDQAEKQRQARIDADERAYQREQTTLDRDFKERQLAEEVRQFNVSASKKTGSGGFYASEVLSPTEAATFGVPYGTTRGQVIGLSPNKLSGEAAKISSIAGTLIPEITRLKEAFSADYKGTLAGIVGGTNRDLVKLVDNIADKVGRLRSGGAINKDEENRFKRQVASTGDLIFGNLDGTLGTLDGLIAEAETVSGGINPSFGGGTIRVRDKATGQTGSIPSSEFDPSIYQRL